MLSCLAAIQAPIILMAQNRSAARDRMRPTRTTAPISRRSSRSRALHDKMDHLLYSQFERMVEMQEIQLDLLTDSPRRRDAGERTRRAHARPYTPRDASVGGPRSVAAGGSPERPRAADGGGRARSRSISVRRGTRRGADRARIPGDPERPPRRRPTPAPTLPTRRPRFGRGRARRGRRDRSRPIATAGAGRAPTSSRRR
ncbi:MAG: DUF1003 domain-containing protein [Deltaproteobacteria bacterium]|nr:DUF1003 domain-containing protein [Deltaproteobacteria bacterium]